MKDQIVAWALPDRLDDAVVRAQARAAVLTAERKEMPASDSAWHLDKKVPIAFILALIVQTSVIVWQASKMDSRIEAIEMKARDIEKRVDSQSDDPVRLARLEGSRDDLSRRLDKIESKIDRLLEARGLRGSTQHQEMIP